MHTCIPQQYTTIFIKFFSSQTYREGIVKLKLFLIMLIWVMSPLEIEYLKKRALTGGSADLFTLNFHSTQWHAIRLDWFRFCLFVQWRINLWGLSNVQTILVEKKLWYHLTHSWGNKGIHTFFNGIISKVNVIAPLDFEPAYYDVPVQLVSHYVPIWKRMSY